MPYFTAQTTSAAALANGSAILNIVPAAAANFHLVGVVLGITNAGGAITDFDVSVGLNRVTVRGATPGAVTINKADPNSAAANILVDDSTTGAPTLAAADGWKWSFNSRGGLALNFNLWDIVSNVGTANGLALIQRSGASLPAAHQITATIEWLE